MSWEQRNADFCNAQTDAQMAYIEAEREVDRLQTENAKLRGLLVDCHALLQRCCDKEDKHGCDCPMRPDHGDECGLRKVERRMRELGIEVGA